MTEQKRSPEDRITEAKRFFDTYKKEIGQSIREDRRVIFVDFNDLSSFSHELAEELIGSPEEIVSVLETALDELGLIKNARVRFLNIPDTQFSKIGHIRAKHLNRFICIEGIVRQASDVRPQVVNAKFECPTCGTIISVLQIEKKFREPTRCSCGRKGQFRLLSKEMVDAQRLVIEESPESLSGGEQPRRLSIFLQEDLVEPKMEEKTTPGSRVKVIGVLKEVPVPLQTGAISTRFDLAIEANNIIPMEETYEEVKVDEEDERQIQELAADSKVFDKLSQSIAPSIWGYDEIKKALVLQMFGGVRKVATDRSVKRGDIHILLIGDPGVAKSQILKFVADMAPKGRYIVGRATSGAGLTATVVRDEFLKGWALEAGAMVLANKGIVCLHPESKIIADNKIVSISDLFSKTEAKKAVVAGENVELVELSCKTPSITEESLQINNQNSTILRRKKYRGKIIKMNLNSGFSIKLTPEHKLIEGNSLNWQEAKKFKNGDFILSPLKIPNNQSDIMLLDIIPEEWIVTLDKDEKNELKQLILKKYKTLSDFNKKYGLSRHYISGGKQFKISTFKEIINEFKIYDIWSQKNLKYGRSKASESLKISKISPELAYFIGFFYGDGNLKINNKHSYIQIVQSLKNENQIKSVKKAFYSFSNRALGEYKRVSKSIIRKKDVFSENLTLTSNSNLISYLCNFFTDANLTNILKLNDDCLRAFIGGCLDSDGCVSVKNSIKNGKSYKMVDMSFLLSNSEEADKNFMLALRRFNCYSKLIKRDNVNIIQITGREDISAILKEISKYSVKIKELPVRRKIISSTSSKLPLQPISAICKSIIENFKNKKELNNLGISSLLYGYANKTIQPSREQLKKIKEKINLPIKLQNQIDILLKSDIFLDKIISIKEEAFEGYVYDLFVPKAHNFIADGMIVHNCIDEIEKMDPNDRSAMHEALEQQTVTISKANVQASLKAETSVLAAGNPKLGRFEPFQTIAQQIELPPTLINRFDVIFPLRDMPDKFRDESIATHVLSQYQKQDRILPVERDLFRKYVAYAKQKMKPVLTDEAIKEIKEFYIKMRNTPVSADAGGSKAIPISARQLEALVRLSEAHAKLRLSKKVTKEDAKVAIEVLTYYLMQVGYDYETKTFDIDKIAVGVSTSQRSKVILLREVIAKLEEKLGKFIPLQELEKELEGKMKPEEIEDSIQKLIASGDVFIPRKGYVQKI